MMEVIVEVCRAFAPTDYRTDTLYMIGMESAGRRYIQVRSFTYFGGVPLLRTRTNQMLIAHQIVPARAGRPVKFHALRQDLDGIGQDKLRPCCTDMGHRK